MTDGAPVTDSPGQVRGPLQVDAEVVSRRRVGAYHHLTLVARGVAEQVLPGQFVALSVGGPDSSMLLRRAFSVYRARGSGAHGGTVEVIFAEAGRGTRWLAGVQPGDLVDTVGPLGRPFRLPAEPGAAVLVGGGYGVAPMFALADSITAMGGRAHFALGAGSADRLFGVVEARRRGGTVVVTTDDGSAGAKGLVTDVLPDLLASTGATTVYACGPMGMLAAANSVAAAAGVTCQVLVEESMACGIGVCMTCVLPVVGLDGTTRMTRTCTDGPVFDGPAVRFADVGTVPADAFGAPNIHAGGS